MMDIAGIVWYGLGMRNFIIHCFDYIVYWFLRHCVHLMISIQMICGSAMDTAKVRTGFYAHLLSSMPFFSWFNTIAKSPLLICLFIRNKLFGSSLDVSQYFVKSSLKRFLNLKTSNDSSNSGVAKVALLEGKAWCGQSEGGHTTHCHTIYNTVLNPIMKVYSFILRYISIQECDPMVRRIPPCYWRWHRAGQNSVGEQGNKRGRRFPLIRLSK